MLYRLLDNLSYKDGRFLAAGTLQRLDDISDRVIGILLENGAIAIPATPPLATLPGWETRARRLERSCEIVTIMELLDADPARIAATLRTRTDTVKAWQVEAQQFIK
ncbi:MAG: hypothetical protein WC565_07515 [Parcubacteria group bacterium]